MTDEIDDKPLWMRITWYSFLFGFIAVAYVVYGFDLLIAKVRGTNA